LLTKDGSKAKTCGNTPGSEPAAKGRAITIAAPTANHDNPTTIALRLMRSTSSVRAFGRGGVNERICPTHAATSAVITRKPGHHNEPRPQVSHQRVRFSGCWNTAGMVSAHC